MINIKGELTTRCRTVLINEKYATVKIPWVNFSLNEMNKIYRKHKNRDDDICKTIENEAMKRDDGTRPDIYGKNEMHDYI